MTKNPRRLLANLGSPSETELAFRAIEENFNLEWLTRDRGHKIQKLWAREDRLSTVELYVFGSALVKVKKFHPAWLKETIKLIKKNESYLGFITEIIACAQLGIPEGRGTITPAPVGKSGFDFVGNFAHGVTHFISVKNHDASDAEKSFQEQARQVRKAWIKKINREKVSLGLRMWGEQPLSSEDFNRTVLYIENSLSVGERDFVQVSENVKLLVHEMGYPSSSYSKRLMSEMTLVCAPAPLSEQNRFRRNILAAIGNMKKNVVGRPTASNVLYMRVHVNADIHFLADFAQDLLDSGENSFDGLVLYQPSYVRNTEGSSLLNSAFRMAINEKFRMGLQGHPAYVFHIPLGSITFDRAKLIMSDGSKEWELPTNSYIFQQGDIYLLATNDGRSQNGNLSSPAPGIRQHSLFLMDGKEVEFQAKQIALIDELLII